MANESRELFYRDKKDGKPQDAALHEEILSGISSEGEARVREIGKQQARKAGLTEDEIKIAYADDPSDLRDGTQIDLTEEELDAIQRQVEKDIANNGPPSDEDLMKEIEKMNDTAPKLDDR